MKPTLAHAGGLNWDEYLLLIPLPILIVILILFAVRARRANPETAEPPGAMTGPDGSAPISGEEPEGNTAI